MEVWGVGLRKCDAAALDPLDAVMQAACRLACGIHASRTEKSWQRRAGVSPAVMYTAARLLPMTDVMDVAHVRFAERMHRADEYAKFQAAYDVTAPDALAPLAANLAPDFMGAAVRASLQRDDVWCARVCQARKTVLQYVPDAEKQYLSNIAITQAMQSARVVIRARAVAAAPAGAAVSTHGRTLHRVRPTSDHRNPIPCVLSVHCKSPCFLRCPDAVVITLLMLRSAHLPGDYCSDCVDIYTMDICPICWVPVIDTEEVLSDVERRWRHVQHQLLACRGRNTNLYPLPVDLSSDLLAACSACPSARRAVQAAFACNLTEPEAAAKQCVPFLLDPMDIPEVPAPVGRHMAALVAVYIELVASCFADRSPDPTRVHACRLPAECRMRTFASRRLGAHNGAAVTAVSVTAARPDDMQRRQSRSYTDFMLDPASSSDDEVVFSIPSSLTAALAAPVHTAAISHAHSCVSDDEVVFAAPACGHMSTASLPFRAAPRGCVADTS